MTLVEFSRLDEMEQAEAIWEHGIIIAERVNGDYRELLYQIDAFYVELHYHIKQNVLKGLMAFEDIEMLRPYLDKINIEGLLQQ